MNHEHIVLNSENNVVLDVYYQDVGGEYGKIFTRPMIVVLPGGGYAICSDREADPIATAYLTAGFQTAVLRYTLKSKASWPAPLKDYETAYELIVNNAEKWHVDLERIAVAGFSAGGHLAACAATVSKYRPQAAILGYPALDKAVVDMCQPNMPYPLEHIDGKTPPFFLFINRDDTLVPTKGIIDFEKVLCDNDISFESHIYSFGGHGFSTGFSSIYGADMCEHAADWLRDSVHFLSDVWGKLTPEGYTRNKINRCLNDDADEFCSIDCTYGKIVSNPQCTQIIKPITDGVTALVASYNGSKIISEVAKNLRLRELMVMFGQNDKIDDINKILNKIPNK